MPTNPEVDHYIAKAAPFAQKILEKMLQTAERNDQAASQVLGNN